MVAHATEASTSLLACLVLLVPLKQAAAGLHEGPFDSPSSTSRQMSQDSFITCPAGSYLSSRERLRREAQLKHHRERYISGGWQSVESLGHNWQATGTSVWCSSISPKPSVCTAESGSTRPDVVYHQNMADGSPGFPLRSKFGAIEFVHNYMADSIAMADALACEYSHYAGDHVSVMTVLDPLDRFAAAVQEVLRRYLYDICPINKTCQLSGTEFARAHDQTRFWPLLSEVKLPLNSSLLSDVMEAFVGDALCCHDGFALDHFATQSTFSTYAESGLDLVVAAGHLEPGLDKLAQRAQRKRTCGPAPVITRPITPVPSIASLREALRPSDVQSLCEIYRQDYICFNISLPKECPELPDLLYPPAPPTPPPAIWAVPEGHVDRCEDIPQRTNALNLPEPKYCFELERDVCELHFIGTHTRGYTLCHLRIHEGGTLACGGYHVILHNCTAPEQSLPSAPPSPPGPADPPAASPSLSPASSVEQSEDEELDERVRQDLAIQQDFLILICLILLMLICLLCCLHCRKHRRLHAIVNDPHKQFNDFDGTCGIMPDTVPTELSDSRFTGLPGELETTLSQTRDQAFLSAPHAGASGFKEKKNANRLLDDFDQIEEDTDGSGMQSQHSSRGGRGSMQRSALIPMDSILPPRPGVDFSPEGARRGGKSVVTGHVDRLGEASSDCTRHTV